MRLQFVVLLVASVVIATTDATSGSSFATIRDDTPAERSLRISGISASDEERGGPVALEKVKTQLPTSTITEKTLARWAQNNKFPKKALIRLNLYSAGDKFFKKPEFEKWVTYMTLLHKQNAEAAVISTLMTRYPDDALSQMLIAAKKVAGTEAIATKLLTEQARVWSSSGKSADEVFGLFQLTKAGDKLLDNPQFTAWTKYVDDLNKNNVEKANAMMTSALATHYTDEALATMVVAGKKVPGTENIATKLEAAQIQGWLSSKVEPVDGFKSISLDQVGAGLLTNPKLNTWVKYMDAFNAKNPRAKTTMVKTFTTYYGDEGLAKMLVAAKNVETTEEMATDLQHAQATGCLPRQSREMFSSGWALRELHLTVLRETSITSTSRSSTACTLAVG
ncbi:hypothetical protein PHYSODRAFT_288779 [Phytophthora sojae]|uniref:RxLR effector protein n=2 Tax=Phytophthora sojae TaxID=67593 RepID=G5A7U9_PHYSP|nr:hypothetical protein PHYSODRAFT_288779 [Phytophthora sojae]AEK80764.1 Avh152 [Phytophthora sojae]EGZ07975.1 hypothetical protein PHYSODRAFT_288779 [Phytophthora sojae]|eukprot:XP_009536147.1 hypothetical protein PHYSODRAFT_288779 [Phytophthora sojae]